MTGRPGISTDDLGDVLGPSRPLNVLAARSYSCSSKACGNIH